MQIVVTKETGFGQTVSEAEYPNLVPNYGWWAPSLQPRGGTICWDLTRNGKVGTLTNMDPATDWTLYRGRPVLDHDNVDDKVVLPALPFGTNDFTISIWALTRANNSSPLPDIFSTRNTGSSGSNIPGVNIGKFGLSGANTIRLAIESTNGRYLTNTYGTSWTNDSYDHWVATYKNATATLTLFKNGIALTPTSTSSGGVLAGQSIGSATSGTIGSRPNADRPLNGVWDDCRIWTRVLTEIEICQMYQLGAGNMPRRKKRRYVEQTAADQDISLNLIAATTTVDNPTIAATSSINLNAIAATTTVYDPTIAATANISLDAIAATTTVYQPTVGTGNFINLNLIPATTQVYNPTLTAGAVDILLNLIAATTIVRNPIVELITASTDNSDILDRGVKKRRKKKQEELDEENVAAQILKARQGKPEETKPSKKPFEIKIEVEQEEGEEPEIEIEVPEPMTEEQRLEIEQVLVKHQAMLKKNKQLRALLMLATMDEL